MRSRRQRRSPILGLLVALSFLVLIEAGLHLAGTEAAYDVTRFGAWRFTANLRGQPLRGPRDGHSFRVTTNADGLRTGLTREQPAGACRIALLGDSTVFGWGVDDGDGVAEATAAALGPGAEVLNAGQPGYTTVMAAALFDEVVSAYEPDVTVLFVPMHDTNLASVSDLESQRGGASLTASLRVGLAKHSRIYAFLRRQLVADADAAFVVPVRSASGSTPADTSRVQRVSDEERSEVLADMRAQAAAWGGVVHIGYVPFERDTRALSPPRVLDAWMLANAGPAGVADLRAAAFEQPDFVLADDDGHLSPSGNRTAGIALATWLRSPARGCADAL